jgi:hypothetical protein
MNQDQIKELLKRLEPQAPEFELIFSGKSSKKVNGLYKPETREILLHNKNFNSDEELVYTAIHEFAHHLHFCSTERPRSLRSHTSVYWSFFHRLLSKAEEMGIYKNVFVAEPEFQKLTDEIKTKYLATNGQLMKDFGQTLLQAVQLCGKHHVRFEDYMDRVLCIPRTTAKTVMASFAQDLTPEFGFDHLKMMTSVKDPEVRRDMELKRKEGYSPEMLRQELRGEPLPEIVNTPMPDPLDAKIELLERSKEQLQKKIEDWTAKLEDLEQKIEALKSGEDGTEAGTADA